LPPLREKGPPADRAQAGVRGQAVLADGGCQYRVKWQNGLPEVVAIGPCPTLALRNAGSGKRDLAGDEGLAAAFRLMVEEDARTAEHIIGLAVLLDNPEAILLGNSIGAVGMERSVLVLGNLLYLAVQLGGRCLIDAASVLQTAEAHSLQYAQHTGGIDIGRELRHIEADLHMALSGQIVDLIRAHGADDREDAHRIAQIAIVQVEARMTLQMGDALTVVDGGTTYDAMNLVALLQKKLCQIGTILTGDTGNQCNFRHILTSTFLLSLQSSAWFSCNTVYYFNEYSFKTEFTILPFRANRLHNIALF